MISSDSSICRQLEKAKEVDVPQHWHVKVWHSGTTQKFKKKKLLLGACTARSIHQLILRKIFNFLLRITVIMFSVHVGIFRITVASYWLRKYRCKLQLWPENMVFNYVLPALWYLVLVVSPTFCGHTATSLWQNPISCICLSNKPTGRKPNYCT